MGEKKKKEEGLGGREELAERLVSLADDLRRGVFNLEGETIPLEEPLRYKWEVKIKGGKLKFELTLNLEKKVSQKAPSRSPSFRVSSPKAIKKTMGAHWKSIMRTLKNGLLPTPDEVNALLETFEAYRPFVDKAWEEQWSLCHEKAQALLQAVREGEREKCVSISAEISALEKECHRKYK